MPFTYFAGAIFTIQEVAVFYLVSFLVISAIIGAAIFIGKKLLEKTPNDSVKSNAVGFGKALLIGLGLVVGAVLLFIIGPRIVKDHN